MQQSLFVLAALFVVAQCTHPMMHMLVPDNAACDLDTFTTCAAAYFKNFGLDQIPETEAAFEKAFGAYLYPMGNKTIDGYKNICKWSDAFVACQGGEAAFAPCVTIVNLIHAGYAKKDATRFAAFAAKLGYECGPGYKVLFDNWVCFNKVEISGEPAFKKCAATLSTELHNDFKHACKYAQEYVGCEQKPYEDACGADAGNFACNDLVSMLKVVYPQCPFTCPAMSAFQRFKSFLHL